MLALANVTFGTKRGGVGLVRARRWERTSARPPRDPVDRIDGENAASIWRAWGAQDALPPAGRKGSMPAAARDWAWSSPMVASGHRLGMMRWPENHGHGEDSIRWEITWSQSDDTREQDQCA